VFLLSDRGEFVNHVGLSAAAERAGVTIDDVLGTKLWEWGSQETIDALQQKFVDCIVHDAPVECLIDSEVKGTTEHWRIHLEPVNAPGRVLGVCTQVFPGETPTLTKPQRELLRMLAEDWTYQEMADRVGCTVNQIHQRLFTIRKRFNVRNNHGLVAAAGRHGLLT
jgi:DNA-binding CsgD family transcriptional regulator